MKYLAAYLLANLAGDASESKINEILAAVGIDADSERINTLITELNGKDINEIIAEGATKLASVPSGGAAPVAAGGAAATGGAAAAAVEEKVEEKEESDDDMGFGLFD
ncbi:60S acidic ribosomal protein P2 [Terramyces sp. JEL0728]|nr:60S acidic ribosomal protein P2 [Terramyces sp. JEL0728]